MAVRNSTFNYAKNSFQIITAGVFFITLALLPIIVSYSEQHQTRIANASPATSLFFLPKTDPGNPLITKFGDIVNLDIYMNPGTNLPYVAKLNIKYDPSVFEADNNSIKIDKNIFPKILKESSVNNGNISITLSTGSDPSEVIKNIEKIGTLTLKAKSSNGGKISGVTFGKDSLILSINESDFPGENVLESAIPAYISVVTGFKDRDKPNHGVLRFNVYLEGIGENPLKEPKVKNINNLSPRHPDKKAEVAIYNQSFEKIMEFPGFISYDLEYGVFRGIALLDEPIPDDRYFVKLRIPGYLDKISDTPQEIISGQESDVDAFLMKAGDINFDNSINALDYNMIQYCLTSALASSNSLGIKEFQCDLNDDLEINHADLELFVNGL